MPDNIATFPAFADWLNSHCERSKNPFIRDSWQAIAACFEVDRLIPDNYGWKFTWPETIESQAQSLIDDLTNRSPHGLNQILWTDHARNIEAYNTMTFWRGMELLKPAIRSLNVHEIIAPAVMARSALELACTYSVNAQVLIANMSQVVFPPNAVVASQELEDFIVKIIWGTRLGEPSNFLKQTNILTTIKKVSENPKAKEVLPTYEYLCELAHPNVIGNTRFWSHVDYVYADGSERRIISRYADGRTSEEILDKILWSLAWSAFVFASGFVQTQAAINALLQKLGSGPPGSHSR